MKDGMVKLEKTAKALSMLASFLFCIDANCATVKELKSQIADKEKEIVEVRKGNPACLLNPNSKKTIRNREIRMIDRKRAKYFRNKQVVFVRDTFWCTKCKEEFDVNSRHESCPAAKASFPLWRNSYKNVEKTLEINKQIDALYEELEGIKELLAEAEKAERAQKIKELEEKRKAKQSQIRK